MTTYEPMHPDDMPPQVLLIDGQDHFVLSVWWTRVDGVPKPTGVRLASVPVVGGKSAKIGARRWRSLMKMSNIDETRRILLQRIPVKAQ